MRRLLTLAAILATIGGSLLFVAPVSMGQALQAIVAGGGSGTPPPAFTGLIDCTDCGSITPAIFWGARAPSFAAIGANSFDVGCNATATASVQFTAVYAANGFHDASFTANSCATTRWLIKAYDASGNVLCTGAACSGAPTTTARTPTFVQNAHGHWCMAFNGNAAGDTQYIQTGAVTASDKIASTSWAEQLTGSGFRMPYTIGNFEMYYSAANRAAIQGSTGIDLPASGSNATNGVYHSVIGENSVDSNSFIMIDGGTATVGDVGSTPMSSGFQLSLGYVGVDNATGAICEMAFYAGATVGTNVPNQTQAAAMAANQAAAW